MAILRNTVNTGEDSRIKKILSTASGNVVSQSIIKVSMVFLQNTNT